MAKKRIEPPEDDGPTINGHAILGPETVQQWFVIAGTAIPRLEQAAPIAQKVNNFDLFGFIWKSTLEYKQARQKNPSMLRLRRISQALAILQKELPAAIEDTRRVNPKAEGEGLHAAIALLELANRLEPAYRGFRRRGREPEGWHRVARTLGPLIRAALESEGTGRAGFGKPTSPAVKVVELALGYLGVHKSCEAIVDAMRGRTKKGGKMIGAKSQTS